MYSIFSALFNGCPVIFGCRQYICASKQENSCQTKQKEIHSKTGMGNQCEDSIDQCSGSQQRDCQGHPLIRRVALFIDSFLFR